MFEAIVINSLGLLADFCSIFFYFNIMPVRNRRLFVVGLLVSMFLVRLLRTFVDASLGWVGIPFLVAILVVTSEGPLFRRLLLIAMCLVILTASEVAASFIGVLLTGFELSTVKEAYAHLPITVLMLALLCMFCLLFSSMARPFARRFMGRRGSTRTGLLVAAFAFVQGMLILNLERCLAFFPKHQLLTVIYVANCATCLLSAVSTILLMRDVQASVDKAIADVEADASMRLADGYMRRYALLEQSIETSAMLRHDIRNQLSVISELAAHGDLAQVSVMVSGLRSAALRAVSLAEAAGGLAGESMAAGERAALPEGSASSEDIDPGGGATALTRRSLTASKTFYLASFFLISLSSLWTFSVSTATTESKFASLLCIAVGMLVMPFLFRMLDDAHDVDVAEERARAAELVLTAFREYDARLESDMREAEQVLRGILASLDDLEAAVERGDERELAHSVETALSASLPTRRWCDHSAVNMLLDIKSQAAKEAGVSLEADVVVPRDAAIPALDLCAVFSNLLDNAVDAARKASEGRRWVRVFASERGGRLVIRTENDGSGLSAKKRLSTVRPGIEEHGWGLRILAELARRHDGELMCGVEGGVYVAQVALALGRAERENETTA